MEQGELVERARAINVTELVNQRVTLHKASSVEWAGECPICGGKDRLHVKADGWFCRQCMAIDPVHGWHDPIDWLQFVDGLSFQDAVEKLTNQRWPKRSPQPGQQPKRQQATPAGDLGSAAWEILHGAQVALADGGEGADYLRGRGFEQSTWEAYGLGFGKAKCRESGELAPAIAMPWFRGEKLTAIRWRFLHPAGKQKITSHPGSRFGGQLFGGQTLPDWVRMTPDPRRKNAEAFCTLVLCEGELNAMSIWQAMGHARLHVLSLGSESSKLSDGAVKLAQRYGRVIVWMDKPDIAKKLMQQVPGSYGLSSPEGQDANDLLQSGKLHDMLFSLRWSACRTEEEREALHYVVAEL